MTETPPFMKRLQGAVDEETLETLAERKLGKTISFLDRLGFAGYRMHVAEHTEDGEVKALWRVHIERVDDQERMEEIAEQEDVDLDDPSTWHSNSSTENNEVDDR